MANASEYVCENKINEMHSSKNDCNVPYALMIFYIWNDARQFSISCSGFGRDLSYATNTYPLQEIV